MGTQDRMWTKEIGEENLSPKGIDPFEGWGRGFQSMSHTRRRDVMLSIPIRQVLPQYDSTSVGRCERYQFILRGSL